MASGFEVRRAGPDDVEAFAAHRRALFLEVSAVVVDERLERALREAYRAGVEDGTHVAWLAVAADGAAVGSIDLALVPRLPSPSNPSPLEGWLAHLYVVPERRRAGVASALVRAAVAEARARDLGRLRLHSSDAGRPLYEHLGFRVRSNDMELGVREKP